LTHSTIFLSGDTHNAHVSRFHEIERKEQTQTQTQAKQTQTQQTQEEEIIMNTEQTQTTSSKIVECENSENCNSETQTVSEFVLGDSASSSDIPIISIHSEPLVKQTDKILHQQQNQQQQQHLSKTQQQDPSKFQRLPNGTFFYEFAVNKQTNKHKTNKQTNNKTKQ